MEKLVTELSRLPGIGRRTAQRLAFHLVKAPPSRSEELARALDEVRLKLRRCSRCHGYSESEVCDMCLDQRRDKTLVCVVEEPTDVLLVERTRAFVGLYHVLGGALSPIDGVDPEHLKLKELRDRVIEDGVNEVVIATNPTPSGEATASYIVDMLAQSGARITRPASGLPVGVGIEHADELTLGRALVGRRDL